MPAIITKAENTRDHPMLWLFFLKMRTHPSMGVWVSRIGSWYDIRANRHSLLDWSFPLSFYKGPKVHSKRAEVEPAETGRWDIVFMS